MLSAGARFSATLLLTTGRHDEKDFDTSVLGQRNHASPEGPGLALSERGDNVAHRAKLRMELESPRVGCVRSVKTEPLI